MPTTHRQEVEAMLAGARAEHSALLQHVSPGLRASLPVDATGITQAIDHLGAIVGRDLHGEQAREHRTNPAVLHGRVFGRAPLSRDTVLAAFADAARVRAEALTQLAGAIGGRTLEDEVRALLDAAPPRLDPDGRSPELSLRDAYAAQERAAIRIAAHADGEAAA